MFFDIVGSLLSLLSTYYFIRLNNKAWLVGILAIFINGWLYWSKGIYADAILELIYLGNMIYGWFKWSKTGNNDVKGARLGSYTSSQWLVVILLFSMLFGLILYFLIAFAHSKIALLDATSTTLSLLAQWLMCQSIIVTWVIWFITDAIYLVMYFNKELVFHSLLMMVYMVLAVIGYLNWFKARQRFLTQQHSDSILVLES